MKTGGPKTDGLRMTWSIQISNPNYLILNLNLILFAEEERRESSVLWTKMSIEIKWDLIY